LLGRHHGLACLGARLRCGARSRGAAGKDRARGRFVGLSTSIASPPCGKDQAYCITAAIARDSQVEGHLT